MSKRARKTAVVGVGNILMGDEGIGVKAVEALGGQELPAGTTLFDGGTAFYALTGELAQFDRLVIVDAVNGGQPAGTIYRFALEEIVERARQRKEPSTQDRSRQRGSLSLHDIGVIEALMLERLTEVAATPDAPSGREQTPFARRSANGLASAEVVIIGIEPARVELSMELSPTLKEKLPTLIQTILGELGADELHPGPDTSARL